MNDVLVAGGGDVSGARAQYVAYSKLSANEGSRRLLFSESEDNLSAKNSYNVLSGGRGKPENGDVLELIVSTKQKVFDKLGNTTEESKAAFKDSIRAGLGNLFKDLKIDNVRYVAGIHLNTPNPHAHILIFKGVQNTETGEPQILDNIPRQLFYKTNFENSRLGQYFDAEISRRAISLPPEMTDTIGSDDIFLPSQEFVDSDRSIKAFTSFAERNNVSLNWLERLSEENTLYVNRQGALTFLKRNKDFKVAGYTNENGWDGKSSDGLFFVGNPQTATKFAMVQSPKDAIALLELVSGRDLSDTCFISCDGNRVPQEAIELLREQSLKRSTKIIWSFNLNRQGDQEARFYESFQQAILEVHTPESPSLEFHNYAPRLQYGKTWKDQLFIRNVPGEIAAMMKREFVFKKDAQIGDEFIDVQKSQFIKDVFERVEVIENGNEFIVYKKLSEADGDAEKTEYGRYKWTITEDGNRFEITSVGNAPANPETTEIFADDESEIIGAIEDAFIVQTELKYIREIELETEAFRLENLQAKESAEEINSTEILKVENESDSQSVKQVSSREILRQEAYDKAKAVTENLNTIRVEEVLSMLGFSKVNRGETVYEDAAGKFRIFVTDVADGQLWNDRKDGMRGNKGGLNLVRHVLDYDFKQAKEWMVNYFGAGYVPQPINVKPRSEDSSDEKKVLKLPVRNEHNLGIIVDYLVNERTISLNLVNDLIERGLIYANGYKSAVFVHRDEDQSTTGASWRATVGTKRQDVAGSDKNKGWFHLGNLQSAKRFVITEAPIEAMSYLELHPGLDLSETVIIAASGNNLTRGLYKQINKQGGDGEIILAFNSDTGGETGILNVKEKLGLLVQLRHKKSYISNGIDEEPYQGQVTVELPTATDWNEQLKEARFEVKEINQAEHVPDEINLLREARKFAENRDQETAELTLETIDNSNQADSIHKAATAESEPIEESERIHLSGDEIENLVGNLEPDFLEKNIRIINIHLPAEIRNLGKLEILFARDPESSANVSYTGYRITFNGDKGYAGYTLEKQPSKSDDPIKTGKLGLQKGVLELHRVLNEKWLEITAAETARGVIKWNEHQFFSNALNEVEIYGRKVTGLYDIKSSFALKPYLSDQEKAVINEWREFTKPGEFYAPEDVFVKKYARNVAKRAAITDLLNRGYLQLETNGDEYPKIKGGNPLLLGIQNAITPESVDIPELIVEKDPVIELISGDDYSENIASTIERELKKLNIGLHLDIERETNSDDAKFLIINAEGEEIFQLSIPTDESDGWIIAQPSGNYDDESSEYIEIATVEYDFELADALGEILNIPVIENSADESNIEENKSESITYRNLGADNVRRHYENDNDHYLTDLRGKIEVFTKTWSRDGKNLYLGIKFRAENKVLYQQKFGDTSFDKNDAAIFSAIKDGSIKVGDQIFFNGYVNENIEAKRIAGQGVSAVPVFASRYEITSMSESMTISPDTTVEPIALEPVAEDNPVSPIEIVVVRRNNAGVIQENSKRLDNFKRFTDENYPELGVSVGYIGNVASDYDDRQYSVYTKIQTDNSYGKAASFGSFKSYDELAEAVFEKGEFDNFLRVIAGARFNQEDSNVSETLDRIYDSEESITDKFLESENQKLPDQTLVSENPVVSIEPDETVKANQSEEINNEGEEFYFEQISPVGDLEFNLAGGRATLEYFTEKGYAITSTPTAYQVWNGSGYPDEQDFTEISEAIVFIGEKRGDFINVRGAYNLRVVPQEHHTFAIYDRAVENVGDYVQTYAQVLETNKTIVFESPIIVAPVTKERTGIKLEWKPRPIKAEDFYNYGDKRAQGRAMEAQSKLARNSADLLNALDQNFGGILTDEAREKLDGLINAIYNGYNNLGRNVPFHEEVEAAKRFSRQIKSDGTIIEPDIPERNETGIERELRIFNELLQENPITRDYIAEFDEEESEESENLTIAIREKNLSIPAYIVLPPDFNDPNYALNEVIVSQATRHEPSEITYGKTVICLNPREAVEKIVENFLSLKREADAEILLDENLPTLANRDLEFEATVKELHQNIEESEEIESISAIPIEAPSESIAAPVAQSENNQSEASEIKNTPRPLQSSKPKNEIVVDSEIQSTEMAEIAERIVGPLMVEHPPQNINQISTATLELPAEPVEKIFEVTATDEDQAFGKNYRWTESKLHHAGSKKRFQWNMAAIELLRILDEERRNPETEEEKTTLAKFSGWGSMKGVFNAYIEESKTWEKERQQAASMLSNEEFAAASSATLNSHFTDGKIVDVAWRVASRLGFDGGRVIEPSVGNGVFLGRIPDFLKDKSQFTGIEKDSLTARIAKKLFPESKIREEGYEDHIVPNGWYDLAIGNVPFGDYKVFDKIYNHLNANIHDYFFLKSLDQVRDGGLQILITSSFTMDKSNDKIRDRIGKEGVLVGALRFPNNTFQKNAGTEVVTDLLLIRKKTKEERQQDIINAESYEIAKTKFNLQLKDIEKVETGLRKTKSERREAELSFKLATLREEMKPIESAYIKENEAYQASRPDWMKTVAIPDPDGGEKIYINKYFAQHPEMVLGEIKRSGSMYSSDSVTVEATDDFDERLEAALELLPENITLPRTEILDENLLDRIIVDETIRNGTIRVDGGKVLRAEAQSYGGVIFKEDLKVTPAETRRIERLLNIRDASRRIINADLQKNTHQSVDELRSELNYLYDSFVRDFGAIHLKKNQDLLKGDADLPRLLAIEEYDDKTKESAKTAIFDKPTVRHFEQPHAASDLPDALGITLNEYGRLYLPRVMMLLNQDGEKIEQTYLRVQKEFIETGIAFLDPKTDEWTMREEYLAGNVRERLKFAELAAESEPERYKTNVEELAKIIPVDLDYTEIDVELGASWLEKDDVADFLAFMTGGSREDFVVAHAERSGFWAIEYSSSGYTHRYKPTTTEIWGTGRCNMIEAVQYLCDGRTIVIKDQDTDQYGKTIYVTNVEETEAANQKAAEIQDEFKDWIWQDETRRTRLARKYNDLFNSFLPVKYDGSHLTFPGMATEINGVPFELRKNQKDAIWRGIREGKALFGHEVGTGKTYLEIALAMKMKQIGLTNKPLLGFLKKNIKQAVSEARELYPHANILTTDVSFDSKKRKETVSKIATGNYDLVFMTHDHIDMLPMRPESRARHINEQLSELDEVMAVAKHLNKSLDGKSKAEARLHSRLEKAKESLEVRLKEVLGKAKDDAIYFEETGIDFTMIDEFHYYKSLQVFTVKTGIKGIPTNYSERAINMYARFSWLQEKNNGRNTYGATGTPITNTMAELYNQQKYFQRETLEERGIIAFDSWMHNFARTISRMEKTATGEYKTVERLCEFTNLPELVAMSGQFLDIYLASEMPELNRPGLDIEIVKSEMSADQRQFIYTLQDRAKDLKYGDSDNMLAISTDARKVSLDTRLVMPEADDDPELKVNKLVEIALNNLKLPGVRTQMVFAELGVHGIVFDDIIKKLIAGGVPKDKIINFSTMAEKESRTAVSRLRSGDALFGFGSTKTLGTGVNAQTNLYAIHNLDTHWLPAYDKQRRGRIERSGNRFYYSNENVKSYYYLTTGGFDEIMYAANDRKQKFIDSVMLAKGDPAKVLHRKVRDADTEEITYAEIAAVASGNPLILVQLDLDKEVRSLSNQERRHNTSQIRLKGDLSKLNRHLAEFEREETLFTLDNELWQRETNRIEVKAEANKEANAKAKEEYNDWLDLKKIEVHEGKLTKPDLEKLKEPKKQALDKAKLPENAFEVELGGILYHNRAEAGEKLGMMVNDRIFHDTVIGVYKRMKIVAQVEYRSEVRTIGLALQSPNNVKYSVNFWTEEGAFQSMEHLSQKLPEFIKYQKDSKESTAVNLEKIQAEIGKPFKYADRLAEAKRELADVEFEISVFSLSDDEKNLKIAERQAKQQQINVTMPAAEFVTAEESGYFDKAKRSVKNAVDNLTTGLPDGSLAKPASKDINPEYYREAARLREEPLSSIWYKMQYENIGGGKMKVNPATYALIQKAYAQTDTGKTLEFAGMYNDPSMVQDLTKTLREQGKINVGYKTVLNNFADAIETTSQERAGTISFIAEISAAKHEGFHADSYVAAAGKTLEARHTRLDQLVEHEAFQIAQAGMKKEYRNDNCAMHVEELANDIAEALENTAENAVNAPHNLNREQMESYLNLWFTSFAEANGLVSREKFEELNENAKQIRDVAYDRIASPQRTTESEEFQSVEPTLGSISSDEKRRDFFEKLCQAELRRKITNDVLKRQIETTEVQPFNVKESLEEQIGGAIILDEKSKEAHSKIIALKDNRYEKDYTVEHQGEKITTNLAKLREERTEAVQKARQEYVEGGFLKVDLAAGEKSKYKLEKDFLDKKHSEAEAVQAPIVEKINKAFFAELRPLEKEAQSHDDDLYNVRASVEKIIAAREKSGESIPMPKINPDTLWTLQENAIKRGDLDSFESLERIHQLSGIPRAPRAASRLAGLAVMSEVTAETEKRDFKVWAEDASETTRIRLTFKNENEKLVTRDWDATRIRDEQKRLEAKADEHKNRASETRKMSYQRLFDPIKNKVNPLSNIQGSVSWLTDPKGTFNAHFNPIEVIKNDPAVQICRAAFDFYKKQGEARIIEARAGEILSGIEPLNKTIGDALDGEVKKQFMTRQAKLENAGKLKEAVNDSLQQEKALRNRLIERGEADTAALGEPKEIFLKDELREVGQASIKLGDAKLLKLYEKAVEKPMIADVLGEGTERVAARVVMAHAETAAVAREAIENVVKLEDGTSGAVELSPSKLLDVQKHLEATEVAEAWLNRLDPEKIVEPAFTETELVRLDSLKYSMDLNSVNAVDKLVSTNPIAAPMDSWTENAMLNAETFTGEIAAQTKVTASISEMIETVNQGASLSPLISDAGTEALAKNIQLYATGSTEIKPVSNNAPEYKVTEPMATVDDGKAFWDKARLQQDERLGVQRIQTQVFEQEQLAQTLTAEAAAGAETEEGAALLATLV